MRKAWLVSGTSGEYSAQSWWPVRVFFSEQGAEEFVKQLDAAAAPFRRAGLDVYKEAEAALRNAGDQKASWVCGAPDYDITELLLDD